jgi:hypothetical protein
MLAKVHGLLDILPTPKPLLHIYMFIIFFSLFQSHFPSPLHECGYVQYIHSRVTFHIFLFFLRIHFGTYHVRMPNNINCIGWVDKLPLLRRIFCCHMSGQSKDFLKNKKSKKDLVPPFCFSPL